MRHLGLLITTAAVAAALAVPTSTGADPVGVCPDGHLAFAVSSERDLQKDQNNNGVVCKKVNGQGQPIGGPDDTVDDIVL